MRQTWEEIGLDLAEKDYMCIGQLDDREITTSLGKRLLMILSPFSEPLVTLPYILTKPVLVFLQVAPIPPLADPSPGTQLHWVSLPALLASTSAKPRRDRRRWTSVTVDVSSRLAPRHSTVLRVLVRMLVGSMQFNAIRLDPLQTTTTFSTSHDDEKRQQREAGTWGKVSEKREDLKLWGLSLGMTLDLMANMRPVASSPLADYPCDDVTGVGASIAPSMTCVSLSSTRRFPESTRHHCLLCVLFPLCMLHAEHILYRSVFPRFSYPDVNFWIWVFGKRYREVVRGWEASMRAGGANDKR